MSKNKTIKFFISSTFKDFEAERNILQKFVFPKLKELCNKNGFGFQPIDLRWGIQEEAGLDQQTMNICLNEIKRSSHEPKPNLLILVGQRYGWIPLPYEMQKEEFEIIITSNKLLDEDKNLITNWYEKDENSIENIYYLKNKHHLTREEWNEIEEQIRVSFQKVFDNPKDEEIYRKYNTSATEQEMYLGLDKFQKEVDNSHTFAYFRKIINYNNEDVTDYIDKDLTKLKKLWEKLKLDSNIPQENQIKQENVQWNKIKQSKNVSYNELNLEKSTSYLKEFHDQILEKFTISIQKEINNFEEQTQLQIELEQQENFLKEKSRIVLGRCTEVKRILKFIKKNDEQFYLQYGKSGSGKTSVMAKAISEINTKEYEVYYRFIGTTANSTYSRILFENIFWEIEANLQNKNDISKPHIEIEEREFKKQFKLQLEKLNNKKVVIFLDALDQFEDYNDLSILLDNLPSNIKIVFSSLYDENKKDNSDYSEYFNRLSYLKTKYELLPLDISTNKEILEKLLESQNRKLTIKQWEKINPNLENITPLHLRLIFEIVKHWKSKQNNLHLEDTQEKLIIQFFEFIVKQYHHEKKLLKLSLGYISASKDGLSEEEILDLFSNDTNFLKLFQNHRYPSLNRLPNAIWSRFYYYVQNIFTEKLIDGEMLIKPYHRIIEEVIRENFYEKNAKQLHKKLSDYFYLKQDKNKTWNERYHNLHMLSEYPYQLFHSKQFEELKEILFDLEFAGSVYDNNKQDSFRDIMSKATQLEDITEDEIYPWESFYREKEHLILRVDEALWRPHQSLFQLAYEDGLDSPLYKIANKLLKNKKINWTWLKNQWKKKTYNRINILSIINIELKESFKIIDSICEKYLVLESKNNLILYDFIENKLHRINNEKYISSFGNDCIITSINDDYNPNTILSLNIFNCSNKSIKFNISNTQFEYNGIIKLSNTKVLLWIDNIGIDIYDLEKNEKKFIDMSHHGLCEYILISKNNFAVISNNNLYIYSVTNDILVKLLEYKKIFEYSEFFIINKKVWNDFLIIHPKEYSYSSDIWDKNYDITLLNLNYKKVKTIPIKEGYANGLEIIDNSRLLYWIVSPSYPSFISDVYIYNGIETRLIYSIDLIISSVKIVNEKEIIFIFDNDTFGIKNLDNEDITIFEGHKNSIIYVKVLKDGYLLSISKDKSFKIWDKKANLISEIDDTCEYIDVEETKTKVIATTSEGIIKIWDKKELLKNNIVDNIIHFDKTFLCENTVLSYCIEDKNKSTLFFKSLKNEILKEEELNYQKISNVVFFNNYIIIISHSCNQYDGYLELNLYRRNNDIIKNVKKLKIKIGYPDNIFSEVINNYLILKCEDIFKLDFNKFIIEKFSSFVTTFGYCEKFDNEHILLFDGKKILIKNLENHNEKMIDSFDRNFSNSFEIGLISDNPIIVYWKYRLCQKSFHEVFYYETDELLVKNIVKNEEFTLNLEGRLITNVTILNESTIVYHEYEQLNNLVKVYIFDGLQLKLIYETSLAIYSIIKLSQDKIIFIFSNNTFGIKNIKNTEIIIFQGHKDKIIDIKSTENDCLISYSKDNTIRFWSYSGKLLSIINNSINTVIDKFNSKYQIIDNNLYTKENNNKIN